MKASVGIVFADVIKGSVITLSLYLAYITFPILGVVAGFVAPLPALVYSLADGKMRGMLIVAVTAAGVWGYAGPAAMVLYLVQAGIVSVSLSCFLIEERPLSHAVLYTAVVCSVCALLIALSYSLLTGANLHEQIVEGINASSRQAMVIYTKSGVTGDELASLKSVMTQVGQALSVAYPSLLMLFLGAVAGVNVLMVRRFGGRWGVTLAGSDFSGFRLPEPLVWLVIAAGFSLFIHSAVVQLVSYNMLTVLTVLYFIQGLAVVVALFGRFAVPALVRIVFYLLVGVQPYLIVAVAFLGLFDIWGNFRVSRPKNL